MLSDWSHALNAERLREVFDAADVDTAVELAAHGAVTSVEWDPRMITAEGLCQVTQTQVETVRVGFKTVGPHWRLARMQCSCRKRHGCAHVAAILLALGAEGSGTSGSQSSAGWERALAPLLEVAPARAVAVDSRALGIVVRGGLGPDQRTLPVQIRPIERGLTGSWVAGRISWADLRHPDTSGVYNAGHRDAMSALAGALRSPRGRWIDLDDTGPGLWTALSLALTAGIELVGEASLTEPDDLHDAPRGAERVAVAPAATLAVEITTAVDGSTLVEPVLSLGDRPPIDAVRDLTDHDLEADLHMRFLGGGSPHGIAIVVGRTLTLAPLRPAPGEALVAMYGRGESVRVPASDNARFRTDLLPRLTLTTPVQVGGERMAAPSVSGPWVLARIRVDGPRHRGESAGADGDETDQRTARGRSESVRGRTLRVEWAFRYEVDGVPVDHPHRFVDAHGGVRDRAAEDDAWRAARSAVEDVIALSSSWPAQAIARCQICLRNGEPGARADAAALRQAATPHDAARAATAAALADPVRFTELESARFAVEVIPRLRADDSLVVEIPDDLPAYATSDATPVLRVSAPDESGAPRAQKLDWLDLQLTLEIDGRTIAVAEVMAALSNGATHMLDDAGFYFPLSGPTISRVAELLAEAEVLDDIGAAQSAPDHGLTIDQLREMTWWEELFELGIADRQIHRWQQRVREVAALARSPQHVEVPESITATLRPYQRDGLDWLWFLYSHGLGGILADDMGLGKTLQTLALVAAARGSQSRPFLVVAPTSLLGNWAAECERFAPSLTTALVSTTSAKQPGPLDERVAGADMVITSYAIFRIDNEAFAGIDWAGVILDEAQFVKNPHSKIYSCVRRLGVPFTLAITGTPMENNLGELWALLSIVAPGLLPSLRHFGEHYRKPIETGTEPQRLDSLRRRIRPVVLRRRKSDVIDDLPPKSEHVLTIDLAGEHRRIYDTRATRERQKVLGLLGDWERNKFAIFRSLTMLRQLSLHPGLVEDRHRQTTSAKVEFLVERLGELAAEGHRALVFSQFTGFLDLLRERLEHSGIGFSHLEGAMSHGRRQREIDAFVGGDRTAFLISLKAGGFGLNLTAADYCFICDPWWNPAAEQQAVDRLHRIGQDNPVTVFRMVSAGTVEEKVVALQERKRELFTAVLDEGDLFAGSVTAADVAELLG
ncbi:DEAD/DEAH box helicase [Gordonia jinhuaensis]|uniref:DEAD/DEAH box helicase n=1 Tax=Gordonia jinhuaensis TaxID=1517702 RepID=UPI00166D76A4|nr:DEAD/DEAH box helicase [Gordonia jinhuaensis]